MLDRKTYGCAESGTYYASGPSINLSGTASTGYSISKKFSDSMSDGESTAVTVRLDRNNWAVYSSAVFTAGTPNVIDLSNAVLKESYGTVPDEAVVEVLGIAPVRPQFFSAYLAGSQNDIGNDWFTVKFDTVLNDCDFCTLNTSTGEVTFTKTGLFLGLFRWGASGGNSNDGNAWARFLLDNVEVGLRSRFFNMDSWALFVQHQEVFAAQVGEVFKAQGMSSAPAPTTMDLNPGNTCGVQIIEL